ncbi:MAG TPA: 1-deoxy-D-xylulose-5-phosphate reductoisomerase [Armatimonadota bacterium]|nr:1-deoxy-D-xylulose-5-phosphate reductoisomerase [Armatimonadota bacterium]HOJ20152.1 1-deoxy-D-xylulose-5-phosphate reductoisomerase [Armatimonadota bacterium]HOM82727.1 1-deoxy-D-xylulose-5-phosphate reductoisomerase [Armatimonadota bacterium]HPO73465.1 1-deoxy-D-xylulose-5-phosphate reductoisomerase [Armatimonadota bacterium]HPT97453.1 1-deoxy-D-xylulose-5-phosphate reductoisomerase [Armatimonadota bacterium]
MSRLAVLGSTGSIGTQTLAVAEEFADRLEVTALAARRDSDALFEQVRRFRPRVCCLVDVEAADRLAGRLRAEGIGTEVLSGPDGLVALATASDVDTVVVSVAGNAALQASLAAIGARKRLAIATKEVLVSAGHLVMREAARTGAEVLPVDSEHSAIFQCLQGEKRAALRRILLTASGGPFLDYTREALETVTVADALAHPTWRMGSKITVDSATLMNKGLEVIEAQWLFGADLSQVEVVVHRQSIVHSLVEFADRSVIAQLGYPDMRLPIQYALFYPERLANNLRPLDLASAGALTFESPDTERFPCLALAYEAARAGGSVPCALNAANEVAVELFLQGRIGFTDIAALNATVMRRHARIADPDLEQILAVDRWAREEAARVAEEGLDQ